MQASSLRASGLSFIMVALLLPPHGELLMKLMRSTEVEDDRAGVFTS